MSDAALRAVTPDDEVRHQPDGEELWNESYYLDFVDGDGRLGGYVRLGFYPNLQVAWWTTALVRDDGPSIISAAYDLVAAPLPALHAEGSGVTVDLEVEQALEAFRVMATATGQAYEDPTSVYDHEEGRNVDLALDLRWTTDGTPYHYEVTTRYEIPCLVSGTVTVDGEVFSIEGQGQRDHSWGVRDWWAFGWCWLAARLDDGTRLHAADIRMPGMPIAFGYVQGPGRPVERVTELEVDEVLGRAGLPVEGFMKLEPGGFDVAISPEAFGPLLLTSSDGRVSRFPRAMARFTTDDGRTGMGWIEWNQPQP